MYIKSFTKRILGAIILLGLTACSQSLRCSQKDVLCVGLVTDTQGINDHGVNQSVWQGLQESDADHVAYIKSVDPRDYEKNIAKFLNDKYDVIVTTGAGLTNPTLHSAESNPDSVFIGVNQTYKSSPPNLSVINFPEDQAGFAAGFLAAKMTRTNIVAAACEDKSFDSMQRYCEGFRNGALYANKDLKVLVEYRQGSSEKLFIDSDWGKATAQKFLLNGADIIFAAGGATAQGAIEEAVNEGAYAIGAERNQWEELRGSRAGIITSFLGSARLQIQKMTRTSGGKSALGEIAIAPYHDVYVGEDIQKQVADLLAKLQAGAIKTDVILQSP